MSEMKHSVRISDVSYSLLVQLATQERRTIGAEMDVIIEEYADSELKHDD